MHHLLRFHPRLWIGLIAGAAIFFVLPGHWSPISRVLVSWNCGRGPVPGADLPVDGEFDRRTNLPALQRGGFVGEFHFGRHAGGAPELWSAIVEPLATIRRVAGNQRIWHFALATVTLIDSWLLVPTIFTTYYADMFYSVDERNRPLRFPETAMPVFLDFAYFSFTIAAACQTADVSTTRGSIRKVVIAHELISFLFNVSILGFAINVTAGLIGGG